ncbi:hypothetical protein [Georgenia muralis]
MSWKKRTAVAAASAALLATGGFAVANAVGPAPAEKDTAPVTHDASTRSALEQELDALMAQVDAMESAAPDDSHDAFDDKGGDRPEGVSDDTGYDDNGGDRPDGISDDTGYDDNGGDRPDGISDDTGYDDNGGDRPDGISDDTGYDDNGGDRPEGVSDDDDDDAWDDHGHDDDGDDWDDD